MSDFTYMFDGEFYTIWPETPGAEATMESILLACDGTNKLTPGEFNGFRQQARKAGYTVRKARPLKISAAGLLAALAE